MIFPMRTREFRHGKKETVGRNILIEALDEHGIRYDLIKERTL